MKCCIRKAFSGSNFPREFCDKWILLQAAQIVGHTARKVESTERGKVDGECYWNAHKDGRECMQHKR